MMSAKRMLRSKASPVKAGYPERSQLFSDQILVTRVDERGNSRPKGRSFSCPESPRGTPPAGTPPRPPAAPGTSRRTLHLPPSPVCNH